MLTLGNLIGRNCQGLHRREFLQVGGASFLGLSLADSLRAAPSRRAKQAQSCILIYLAGGPSQLETFDPKPDAPLGVRGPWSAIPTRVPGIRLGEMLPRLAALADRYALIRSLHHTNSLHQPWPILSGSMQHRITYGAAATFLRKSAAHDLPPYVHLGARLSVGAGTLGASYEPLVVANPLESQAALANFTLTHDVNPDRLLDRRGLLQDVDRIRRLADRNPAIRAQDSLTQRAFAALTSTRVRDAFDLSREDERLRDRYGANYFGQSCLLARRLVEAGTRFIQIVWYDREDGFAVGWDVHGDDFNGLVRMEQQLCPRLDQGLSALLEDLHSRGLLDSTLVCATGEFGRTPRISRHGGRDHWPYCFPALLAGGPVPGGAVIGGSDGHAAFPNKCPVTPADFAATLYHLLGVDVGLDDRLRPAVFEGHSLDELCRDA